MIISTLAALAAMYVEFQFYASAFAAGKIGSQFFATYHSALALVALLLQLVVAPRLRAGRGLTPALLALPAGILGGAGLVILTTTAFTQSVFRVLENGLKNAIHRSSWEQVFLSFGREQRNEVKVLVDGAVPRLAGVLGAAILYVLVARARGHNAAPTYGWLSWLLVGLAILWIVITVALSRYACVRSQPADADPLVRLPDS